jgi:hypothetical protein
MEKPLVNKTYKLEKYPGKGGWTYTVISEISPDKRQRFGMVRVKGFIDDYEIKSYHLMPMKNGKMFLPIKADIRKKIKKKDGDSVKIILFIDNDPLHIPDEFLQCLRDDPGAYKTFNSLDEGNRKLYVDWIYSSKKEDTRIARMAEAINRLEKGLKFSDVAKNSN